MSAEAALIITQLLNGVQLGLLLFLVAAGLTLIFGVLDFVNLAHGAFVMLGAFISASIAGMLQGVPGGWLLGVVLMLPLLALLGMALELLLARPLQRAGLTPAALHLAQVLATFGVLLACSAVAMMIWGTQGMGVVLPGWLRGQVALGEAVQLPAYRLFIIVIGLMVALALHLLLQRTRLGMQLRAVASNADMAAALGAPVDALRVAVFALGAALAGLAGALMVPIAEASLGMAVEYIIIAFVIIIIGGLGSLKGSFFAALLVGMLDTLGRAFLDDALAAVLPLELAETAAPALSSMSIYLLMAAVLIWKPAGLFPPPTRGRH